MNRLSIGQQVQLILRYFRFVKENGDYLKEYDMIYKFVSYLNIIRGKSVARTGTTAQILAGTGAADMLDLKLWFEPHYNNMNNYFDLDNKKLVEVGAGVVPVLADKIARLHPTSFVTAIDPEIVPNWSRMPNLNAVRATLTSFVNMLEVEEALKSCDMLYATYPCAATVSIIKEANERDKDLYLAMCGCVHSADYTSYDDYASYILNVAKTTLPLDRKIEIQRDRTILEREWPIIITYKSKHR